MRLDGLQVCCIEYYIRDFRKNSHETKIFPNFADEKEVIIAAWNNYFNPERNGNKNKQCMD
jgi:hypothetical protein